MTILLIAFLFLTLAGFITLQHAIKHAVDGYEDETGFYIDTAPQTGSAFVVERVSTESDVHPGTLPSFQSKL
jgi:hypothetical protein